MVRRARWLVAALQQRAIVSAHLARTGGQDAITIANRSPVATSRREQSSTSIEHTYSQPYSAHRPLLSRFDKARSVKQAQEV